MLYEVITETRLKSKSKSLMEEKSSLFLQRQELENKISELEKEKETKQKTLETLREKEQELISSSGSSIGRNNFV